MRLTELVDLRQNKYSEHRKAEQSDFGKGYEEGWYSAYQDLKEILATGDISTEELRPKGEWIINQESDDGFKHHCCSRCKVDAVFHYEYCDDLDEDMDGEWFVYRQRECGIVETLSDYCPNCGAKMRRGE